MKFIKYLLKYYVVKVNINLILLFLKLFQLNILCTVGTFYYKVRNKTFCKRINNSLYFKILCGS